MKQRHRDEGPQPLTDIPRLSQTPDGVLGVGHECLVGGRHTFGVPRRARRVEQCGDVGAAELVGHVRLGIGQRGLRAEVDVRPGVGQHEFNLWLRRPRIHSDGNASGHHRAPESQHPVDPRGITHRDTVARFETGRTQPTGNPRGAVPQLPVRQPVRAQLDHGFAVRALVDLLGKHVKQGGREVVVTRNAVDIGGNPGLGEWVAAAGNFDHTGVWRHARTSLSGVLS